MDARKMVENPETTLPRYHPTDKLALPNFKPSYIPRGNFMRPGVFLLLIGMDDV